MISCLIKLSVAYHALIDAMDLIKQIGDEEDYKDWERLVDRIQQKASDVSRKMVKAKATSPVEWSCNARRALCWIALILIHRT